LDNKNILDHFNQYFEMVPAISDELKNEVNKLRYQVYCIENKFLNSEHYPNYLEFDDYDQQSVHYLIRHTKSGNYIATTRLILPYIHNHEKPFPIEIHSQIDNVNLLKTMPRHNLAELSRFCVSKEFRRRKNEQHLITTNDADAAFNQQDRRSSSYLTLALFACAIKMSYENDIHYWYAIMEPALERLFSSLGIHFVGIGPLVDYHGKRRPFVIKVDDLLDSVAKKDLNYWNMLTNNGHFGQRKPPTFAAKHANILQDVQNSII
jgi:N-acyl amino acid synthase of PEP-CTERM/exosortase system